MSEANIKAMAEALYQAQCEYVGANHEEKCVEILTTALQSFEDVIVGVKIREAALIVQNNELEKALRDLLNDCINFDGGKLSDCMMKQATKALAKTPEQSLSAHNKRIRDEAIESQAKNIAVKFFQHWWNSHGVNTEQGFDDWWQFQKSKFLSNPQP